MLYKVPHGLVGRDINPISGLVLTNCMTLGMAITPQNLRILAIEMSFVLPFTRYFAGSFRN